MPSTELPAAPGLPMEDGSESTLAWDGSDSSDTLGGGSDDVGDAETIAPEVSSASLSPSTAPVAVAPAPALVPAEAPVATTAPATAAAPAAVSEGPGRGAPRMLAAGVAVVVVLGVLGLGGRQIWSAQGEVEPHEQPAPEPARVEPAPTPEPAPAPAPAVVEEAEPAPAPPAAPAPAPAAAPTPPRPAPAPAPEPAVEATPEPVAAAPGKVRFVGELRELKLVGSDGAEYGAGPVPPGEYAVKGKYLNADTWSTFHDLSVGSGDELALSCNNMTGECKLQR